VRRVLVVCGARARVLRHYAEHRHADFKVAISSSPNECSNNFDVCITYEQLNDGKTFRRLIGEQACHLDVIWSPALKVDGPFVSSSEQEDLELVNVNVNLLVKSMKSLVKVCMTDNTATFIFLSSIRVTQPSAGATLYGASKAFGETLFRSLGVEYGRFGLRFNVLRLGLLLSGMARDLGPAARAKIVGRTPQTEAGSEKDVYSALDFLFDTDFCNLAMLPLDGGAGSRGF